LSAADVNRHFIIPFFHTLYTQRSRDWFIARGQFFAEPTNDGDQGDLSTSFSMTYKPETIFFMKKTQYIVD
jgi:hypothetical protein